MSDPNDYTVGWICAITAEYVAAQLFLDEKHEGPAYLPPRNTNDYTLGRVGKHNVVIAVLPMGTYGIASAARVAENMLHSFPNVRFGLMVGIGGGAPSQKHDIRLGDVVVSIPSDGRGGVLQYDYGEAVQNKEFRITSVLDQPPTILRAAVSGLQAEYEMEGHGLDASVDRILQAKPRLRKKYQRPEQGTDQLYHSNALHHSDCESCENCANDPSMLILRIPRDDDELNPAIHYGLIASSNRLMSDALLRDKLSAEHDILCFESEAAGLMNGFPCLVIRGICDYSDSHKSKMWQGYSAMVASAYSRDILYRIPPQQVMAEARIVSTLKPMLTQVVETTERMEIGIEFDRLTAVPDAQFDSYRNQHDEFCLPGTRAGVINGISEWAHSPTGKPIFWLNGMAGTGKSTITRTLARYFKKSNMLGASFFFKRGESNRGSMQWLLPTISKQLAQTIPELRPSILTAIKDDPDISTKGLPEQFEKLILQPLLSIANGSRTSPVVIVIDALDECETQNDVAILLRLLPRVGESISIITRVFLTSRPEILIRLGFSEIGNDSQDLVLHEIPEEVTERDITLFLRYRMASIRTERRLPVDWPSDKDLFALVRLSVPLFIFAATMCRLFQDHQMNPILCLSDVLAAGSEGSQLNATYMPVLNRILDTRIRKERVAEEFRVVVGAIILLENPLSIISLSKLIDVPESVIDTRLNSLHSVIRIPDKRDMPLRLFHLSFRDFLLDPETKEKNLLWIDVEEGHHKLALDCLSLCRRLRRNICSLPSDGTLRTEIDQKIIDQSFPPELRYSCMFWAHHVMKSGNATLLARESLQFLHDHFLHWLEAMNLIGLGYEAISIIQQVKSKTIENAEIYDFLREGERFAVQNQHIADRAPLQLYSSSLVFAPKESIFRNIYRHEIPRWIERLPEVNDSWDIGLRQFECNGGDAIETQHRIAFSHDGQLIAASSCADHFRRPEFHTVRVWHAATGVLQQTFSLKLNSKHGSVFSIAFAPDSQKLAHCFNDGTVVICDLNQRAVVDTHLPPDSLLVAPCLFNFGTCPDKPSEVSSISGRGWKIAYSPVEEPIQVWSLLTFEKTHQSPFNNEGPLTISPDGRLVASCPFNSVHQPLSLVVDDVIGSERRSDTIAGLKIWDIVDDTTEVLRIWNAFDYTKEVIGSSFNHRTCSLQSSSCRNTHWPRLTFSPNNQLLAVQSRASIELWDVPKKTLKWEIKGEFGFLAFSFDDTLLASNTYPHTIRIWNLVSGNLQHVFRDFGRLVSLAFSPNGYRLASTSRDGRIQLRDLSMLSEETDPNVFNWLGHGDFQDQILSSQSNLSTFEPPVGLSPMPNRIIFGAVSPDCRLFVAFSDGMNGGELIQLWDIVEGRCLRKFESRVSLRKSKSAAISHGNEFLVIGYEVSGPEEVGGAEIEIFEIATDGYRHFIPALEGSGVSFLCFSPDDQILFVAHADAFFLWNMARDSITLIEHASNKVPFFEYTLGMPQCGHIGAIPKFQSIWNDPDFPLVSFSRSGLLAYTGLNDIGRLVIYLCETLSGSTRYVLRNDWHSSEFQLLSFSPDDQLLAAATVDKEIHIWDVNSGLLRHSFSEKESINKLQFTADSSTLIYQLKPLGPQDDFAHLRKPRPWGTPDIHVSPNAEWISYKGENILWLPSEFRPHVDRLIVKDTLVMSHSAGGLSFIGFDFRYLHGFVADREVRRDLRDTENQLKNTVSENERGAWRKRKASNLNE